MSADSDKATQSQSGSEAVAAKSRKRHPRKPAKAAPVQKLKVTYYLSSQAVERVGVAAAMEHADRSEIVERLIQEHLKQWVVSFRGQKSDETEEESRAGE